MGVQHHKEISCVPKLYSQSQNVYKDIASKQDSYASDGPTTTDEDNEFPLINEVIRRALSKELLTKELTSTVCTA
jgi:hypothetical protein